MELRLAGTFLPLLLLTWLPAGLAHQISGTIHVSVGFDTLQCLLQAGLNSTTMEVRWRFKGTQNNGEEQNEGGVEMKIDSLLLTFATVNRSHAGMCTCGMENKKNMSENSCSKQSNGGQGQKSPKSPQNGTKKQNKGTVSQPVKPDNTVQCKFENLTVQVKWYEFPEVANQVDLEENSTSFTICSMCTAHTEASECKLFIKRPNSTDTGNSTQTSVPRFDLFLCILLGLAVGTLLYMPVIGFLLCQCRRNRTGKLPSGDVAEGNQLSTAAPVTGTVDLTYASLKFEQNGTEPASSNVIYTEIKPLQQKQHDGDASAASTGVAVSPEEEGR